MQLLQPKVIEKEFLCIQHKQQIESVILDSKLSKDQRLLCKFCSKQNPNKAEIVNYLYLKQNFDRQQTERIIQYQPIIKPHIEYVENLQKIADIIRTKIVRQIDNLLGLSKDWITNLADFAQQYSFFGELDNLIENQQSGVNSRNTIQSIKNINDNWNIKIQNQLDLNKLIPEIKNCEEIFQSLNQLIHNQEIEINQEYVLHSKIQQNQKEEQMYHRKEDLFEVLSQTKNIDGSILNYLIMIMKQEKINNCLEFISNNYNDQTSLIYIANLIQNIGEIDFNKKNYSTENQEQIRKDLIKKISQDKNIIEILKFLVHLTAIDERFIQSGSNSLNILVEMKVDLREQVFENIRIRDTSLVGGNFTRCNLNGSNFDNVDISGIKLNEAQLINCCWRDIKIYSLNKLDSHSSCVNSVCFSPDGTTLASGSGDKSIRLWDVKTGQQIAKLYGHSNGIISVCFSPDGTTIASGSDDKSISIWDVKTEQQIAKLYGHTDWVYSVCFSPDGTTLASGSYDNSIRFWDAQTGQQKAKLDGHIDQVNSVCFSLDGTILASGSSDNSIRLWDVKTGQQKAQFDGHTNWVYSVCFSPDGIILASGSSDNSIRLWDVKTGQQKAKLFGHCDQVYSVCFSFDGTTLASGSGDKSIRFWDVETGQQTAQLDGHLDEVISVTFAPKNTTLASGSRDNSIGFWDGEKNILPYYFFQNKATSNITLLKIYNNPNIEAKGAKFKGEFVNNKGVDLRQFIVSKGGSEQSLRNNIRY